MNTKLKTKLKDWSDVRVAQVKSKPVSFETQLPNPIYLMNTTKPHVVANLKLNLFHRQTIMPPSQAFSFNSFGQATSNPELAHRFYNVAMALHLAKHLGSDWSVYSTDELGM